MLQLSFYDNFGKARSIFFIHSMLNSEMNCPRRKLELYLPTTSPQGSVAALIYTAQFECLALQLFSRVKCKSK